MKQTTKELIKNIIDDEITRTTGCTDPGAVCLAVAKAVEVLQEDPQSVEVIVSPSIYKNGVNVGIPGTGKRGLRLAAGLGLYLSARVEEKLALLNYTTPQLQRRATEKIEEGKVRVSYREDLPSDLYIKAVVQGINNECRVVIRDDYDRITEINRNGKIIKQEKNETGCSSGIEDLHNYKIKTLVKTVINTPPKEFRFLKKALDINLQTAERWDKKGKKGPGHYFSDHYSGEQNFPGSAVKLARYYISLATVARMSGERMPIMAITGSGNHGIINFLGVYAVAESLQCDEEKLLTALAISSLITVYIKGHIKRMTAFCGCSVAVAPGVAAAAVYLLDGDYEQMVKAMNTVIGTLAGMVCDGAKESCAFKIGVSAATAIENAHMVVRDDVYIAEKTGIVAGSIEETFRRLGRLNNPGMRETDRYLLKMVGKNKG